MFILKPLLVKNKLRARQPNRSCTGELPRLHYSLLPLTQGTFMRAASDSIFDVAVDIRKSSPSFEKWVDEELSAFRYTQVGIRFLAVPADTAKSLIHKDSRNPKLSN